MLSTPFPESYEQWRYCITESCGIPLTQEFITQRLAILRNENAEETARFRDLYGDDYWRAVVHWFELADQEVAG